MRHAILAFVIGPALICFGGCGRIDTLTTSAPGEKTHSEKNNSPHAVLEATTVRLKPFEARFEIPESWTKQTYKKNLFLSWEDLNELHEKVTFEDDETEVMDSVIPFKHCAVHVGEKGWDSGVVSDQFRVYVVELVPSEIRKRIERNGMETAERVFDRATLSSRKYDRWEGSTIDFVDAPTTCSPNSRH